MSQLSEERFHLDVLSRRFGAKYRIFEVLGQGATSCVFRATQIALDRPVVLKVLSPDVDQPDLRRRFAREAKILAGLDHPHIVGLLDYGIEEGQIYIAYPDEGGMSGDRYFEEYQPLPVPFAARVLEQVLEALECLRPHGIVHRDLKPANIIFLPDDRVKVIDFGIARSMTMQATPLTGTGDFVGTLAYASPELITGAPPDAQDDLYAAGIIAYEALVGANPFLRSGNISELITAQLCMIPDTPRQKRPEVPVGLSLLVMDMLAKTRGARPETAAAALQRLRELKDDGSMPEEPSRSSARSPGRARPSSRPSRSVQTVAVAEPPPATSSRSSGVVPAGIVASGVFILILVVVRSFVSSSSTSRVPPAASPSSTPASTSATAPSLDLLSSIARAVSPLLRDVRALEKRLTAGDDLGLGEDSEQALEEASARGDTWALVHKRLAKAPKERDQLREKARELARQRGPFAQVWTGDRPSLAAQHLALYFGYRTWTICEYLSLDAEGSAISKDILNAAPTREKDSWVRRYIALRDDFHDARRRSGKQADEWYTRCAQDAAEAMRLLDLESKQGPSVGAEDLRLELLFRRWEAQHRVTALKAQGNVTWDELQRLRAAPYAGPAGLRWFHEELVGEMAQD